MNLRYATPVILSLCLALSGCNGLGTVLGATSGTIASVAPDSVNTAKRLLTASHEAHRVTADLLTVAATSNLCHSTCAAQAKVWLDQSEAALAAGDKLIALGDAPGVEAKISAASSLLASVQNLLGKH